MDEHKSDAKDEIIALITELETSMERKLKVVQLNGGGEFLNNALRDWFKLKGISLEISAINKMVLLNDTIGLPTNKHSLC